MSWLHLVLFAVIGLVGALFGRWWQRRRDGRP
jgi:hypothetical protein